MVKCKRPLRSLTFLGINKPTTLIQRKSSVNYIFYLVRKRKKLPLFSKLLKVFEELMNGGLKLITRKRKNMKNDPILSTFEKQLLNQRNLIETVIDHLKHHYQVWHSRHRSIINALTHLVAALAAYAIEPLKLSAIKLLSLHKIALPHFVENS